ncbi:FCD domain-containing protein [Streptomyces sp. DSM 44915]|uniref:FCD domain-containing protein n=1 Tax=Streptomyces chisholmiae TaxID=3075540 RepID=A0ABU2JVJ0_9ACTN|nr:FCD domain-containing protein [Streptomyces sp. DSM 44915]MDT0268564.1 FCD domain-containing protein [Streptomyces sp. DSM 44915]
MASYSGRGVHGQVVHHLGARIVGGEYTEGETLDVRALGAELDVSLTVLRESLKVLAGKGLVDARQKRGTFVRPRAAWHLLDSDVIRWRVEGGDYGQLMRDLADVRAIVEPAAAHRAAVHHTAEDLAALEAALAAMAAAGGDNAAAAEADSAFHRALLAATGNELLARLEVLLEPGLRERDLLVHSHLVAADPVPSHRAVLDAIRARDASGAQAAMLALLAQAADDADPILRRLDQRTAGDPGRGDDHADGHAGGPKTPADQAAPAD